MSKDQWNAQQLLHRFTLCTQEYFSKFAFVINSAAGHSWDDRPFTDEQLCFGFQCLYDRICKRYTSLDIHYVSAVLQDILHLQSSTTDPPTPLLTENNNLTTHSLLTTTHNLTYYNPSTTQLLPEKPIISQ